MYALIALIVRFIISLAVTVGIVMASTSKPNVLEFLTYWFLLYAVISAYFHARRIMCEEDEEELIRNGGKKYKHVSRFEQEHPFFDIIFEYIIMPVVCIVLSFIVVPQGISRIFPETWRENVQLIIGLIEIIGIIGYDIWKVKEAYDIGELEFNTEAFGGMTRSLIKTICILAILGFLAFGVILFLNQETINESFSGDNPASKEVLEKFKKPEQSDETTESTENVNDFQESDELFAEPENTFESTDAEISEKLYVVENVSDTNSMIGSIGKMEIEFAAIDVRYVKTEEVELAGIYELEKKAGAMSSDYIPELYDKAVLVVGKYLNELTGIESYGYCVFFEPSIDEETVSFSWKSKYERLECTEDQIRDMISNDVAYNFIVMLE